MNTPLSKAMNTKGIEAALRDDARHVEGASPLTGATVAACLRKHADRLAACIAEGLSEAEREALGRVEYEFKNWFPSSTQHRSETEKDIDTLCATVRRLSASAQGAEADADSGERWHQAIDDACATPPRAAEVTDEMVEMACEGLQAANFPDGTMRDTSWISRPLIRAALTAALNPKAASHD